MASRMISKSVGFVRGPQSVRGCYEVLHMAYEIYQIFQRHFPQRRISCTFWLVNADELLVHGINIRRFPIKIRDNGFRHLFKDEFFTILKLDETAPWCNALCRKRSIDVTTGLVDMKSAIKPFKFIDFSVKILQGGVVF
jgi:hypothetical protein